MGINNLGQVIGWDSNGTFISNGTQLTSLSASIGQPFSISDKDQIIAYSSALENALGVINLKTGAVQQIANPYYPTANSNPSAINNAGAVVGLMPGTTNTAFLYQGDTYTALLPSNDPNSWVDPAGINNGGQVVGTFLDTVNPPAGETGVEEGFIYTDGTFQYVAVPNAVSTEISGINDYGEIIGTYMDGDNVLHTFLGTPVVASAPEPSCMALFGSGLFCLALIRKKRVRVPRH